MSVVALPDVSVSSMPFWLFFQSQKYGSSHSSAVSEWQLIPPPPVRAQKAQKVGLVPGSAQAPYPHAQMGTICLSSGELHLREGSFEKHSCYVSERSVVDLTVPVL